MGAPMAQNLARSGHHVNGYDIVTDCPTSIHPAKSLDDAVSGKEVIITMLPDGQALRDVADTILPNLEGNIVWIDCSTIDIDSARSVSNDAGNQGVEFMDAPVSGGVVGATNGTLTFMVGGSIEAFQQVEPLLEIMGGRVVHCGPTGSGQAAKICNNMILGTTMVVTCEAFALADKLQLDRQKLFDVVSTSSGYSWSMNVYCPAPGIGPESPSDNEFKPGFATDLMLKDLRLSQQAAELVCAETPLGQATTKIYQNFVENEDGSGLDFSAIIKKFTK